MPWTWHAHPDVWILIAAFGGGYVWALLRLGPARSAPGTPAATRSQKLSFGFGLVALWLAADWPVHDLAEDYLYSAHMTQHLMMTLVVPPLLLLGMPAWMMRELLAPPAFFRAVRRLARPMAALVLFNGLIVVTHWPALVDLTLDSEVIHFLAHAAIFLAAALMWCPVVAPLPELRTLQPPAQMLYLFAHSIVPTVPASFLVFSESAIYKHYDTVPRLWGISVIEDQRIGGLLMKLAGGALLWAIITVLFFKWHSQEEADERTARKWRELDDEVTKLASSVGGGGANPDMPTGREPEQNE